MFTLAAANIDGSQKSIGKTRMVFWICIVLILILATLFCDGDGESFFGICAFGTIVIFIFICMIGSVVFEHSENTKITHSYKIISLQDNEGTEGHIGGGFFFITGNIGTYQFYSWYERQADGSYESRQISTHNFPVKIWEEPSSAEPKAIQREICHSHSIPGWLSPIDFAQSDECETEIWELFVPQGTIVHDFKLDASS